MVSNTISCNYVQNFDFAVVFIESTFIRCGHQQMFDTLQSQNQAPSNLTYCAGLLHFQFVLTVNSVSHYSAFFVMCACASDWLGAAYGLKVG